VESEELANTLVANALVTSDELYGNKGMAQKLRDVYKALYAKYAYGTEIPQDFYTLNTEQ